MNDPETLQTLFGEWLSESERVAIINKLGVNDDRPSILRGRGGRVAEGQEWIQRHRVSLGPVLLRYVDPPDDLVAQLVSDGDLKVPAESDTSQTVVLSGFPSLDEGKGKLPGGLPLPQVAAASGLVLQACVSVAAANRACGIELSPPDVAFTEGSFQITVAGGLFASGMGLLVACAAGLVGAPIVGAVAGVTLATAGVVELALGWRKTVAEESKTRAEAGKTDAERRLTEINIKLKELELEQERLRANVVETGRRVPLPLPPESAEISRQVVHQYAVRFGMSEAYANHVLNRGLPGVRTIRQKLAGVELSVLPTRASRPGRAG